MPSTPDRTPERIRAASRRSAALGAAVPGALSLAMGEPDGGTPQAVVEAAVDALRAGRTRYAPFTGSPTLRAALAEQLSGVAGRQLGAEQVVLTHGGSAGLAATVLALVSAGDRVLVPEPTYSLYPDLVAMAGGKTVWIPPAPGGTLDLPALAAAAPGARMLILCTPSNPTGRVLTPAELDGVAALLRAHPDLVLLCDEAYRDIVFDGRPATTALSLHELADQVVVAGTFSKSYAMTGWRLGHVVASPEVAARIDLVHRTFNGPLNTVVQDAALAALALPAADLTRLAEDYQRRRDLVLAHLTGAPRVDLETPQGAFYAFPRIHSALTSAQLTSRLAAGGVLVRDGAEFGPSGEGHVRLSFATGEAELAAALTRFTDVLTALER